jgi:hypothetical protein
MKYFLEMIATVKKTGKITKIGNKEVIGTLVNPTHFFTMVKKAHVFVFSPKNKTPLELASIFDKNGDEITVALDAPFSVFAIEVLNGELTVPEYFDISKITTHCLLAYETSPKEFSYYAYCHYNNTPVVIQTTMFDNVCKAFIDRLNSERQGVEKVDKLTVLLDEKKRKYEYRIKKIIHISPKRDQISINPNSGKIINWSHQWFVRGHWRKHSGLGKDREGVYCMENFTWVTEHKKGPEEKKMQDKVRLVK